MRVTSVDDLDAVLAETDEQVLAEFAARLSGEMEARRVTGLRRLELFVTERCNLRCDYCFLQGSSRQGDMPLEVADRALQLLMRHATDVEEVTIVLFGGEPLVCIDRLEAILGEAHRTCGGHGKGLSISCTTNGLLLDQRALELGQRYGFLYLLSVDGLPEVHDRHRRTASGEPTFERLVGKIHLLKAHQRWVGARLTVAPDSIGQLAAGVRLLFSLGVNQFLIGLVSEAEWQPEQIEQIKTQYYDVYDFYVTTREKGLPIRLNAVENWHTRGGKENIWGCSAGVHGITVDASGRVFPCARFLRHARYQMGTVEAGPNWEVGRWLSDRRREVRWKCLRCEYSDHCGGGCPEVNFAASGSPYYPPEAHCAEVRAVTELMAENPRFQVVENGE